MKRTRKGEAYGLRKNDDAMYLLCDSGFRNEVQNALLACWADDKTPEQLSVLADLIDEDIIGPLQTWERRTTEGPTGIDAGTHYEANQFGIAAEKTARAIRQGGDLKAVADDLISAWVAFGDAFNSVVVPLAREGKTFRNGRKPGTVGPVRKAIARYLKKNPAAKNTEIWTALFAAQPRGLEFFDNPRLGQYVVWTGSDGTLRTTYRHQFETICGEERKKLYGKIRS